MTVATRQRIEDEFQRRNREIGEVIAEARRRKQRSVTECAGILATSRRRYNAIERGEVPVNVVELETLARYLEVPLAEMWREISEGPDRQVAVEFTAGLRYANEPRVSEGGERQVVVEVRSGEQVKVILQLKKSEA
jgi:transcriptional regulator with XRE-family HTH domain